jgi:hypothetical protein
LLVYNGEKFLEAAPEIDAYGAAFVGMPLLAIAFNDNLGWTATVNLCDRNYGLSQSIVGATQKQANSDTQVTY